MASYKEIVTKAVIGKGKKSFKNQYDLTVEEIPTTILGCWVINHNFEGFKNGDSVGVTGTFDINIWYSYDNDTKTKVANETIEYSDTFNVKLKSTADLSQETDIIVRSLAQPTCSDVEIENNKINFVIDKELGVEIVGETKVKIAIEEEEEPWDIIEDDVTEEDLEKIEKEVNEEYLN